MPNSQQMTAELQSLQALKEIADRLRSIEDRVARFDVAFEHFIESQKIVMLALFGNPADQEKTPGIILRLDRLERSHAEVIDRWQKFRGLTWTTLAAIASAAGGFIWHLVSKGKQP